MTEDILRAALIVRKNGTDKETLRQIADSYPECVNHAVIGRIIKDNKFPRKLEIREAVGLMDGKKPLVVGKITNPTTAIGGGKNTETILVRLIDKQNELIKRLELAIKRYYDAAATIKITDPEPDNNHQISQTTIICPVCHNEIEKMVEGVLSDSTYQYGCGECDVEAYIPAIQTDGIPKAEETSPGDVLVSGNTGFDGDEQTIEL